MFEKYFLEFFKKYFPKVNSKDIFVFLHLWTSKSMRVDLTQDKCNTLYDFLDNKTNTSKLKV